MKRTHIALVASTLLLLTTCSGTGGASHDGEVYLGAPSSGPTVQQIMELADSGDVEAIVNLITKSTAAAAGGVEPDPSPVTFQADELGIPMGAGFTVDILMTVTDDSGTSTKTFTSTVADDGSISFDIPPVVTGSEVSIRMDVRDDSGMLVQTGRAKKTVSGDSDTLELTLSSFFTIPLTPPAAAEGWVWLTSDDNYIWELYSSDEEFRQHVSKEGSTVYVGGLAVIDNVIYEIPTTTITVGTDEDLALTLNTAKKFDPNSSYITAEYRGSTRDKAVCHRKSDANVPALFDDALILNIPAIFSVVPTAFHYSSADPPPDSLSTWGVHWGEIDTDNWTAILNAVVASDSWWLAMTYSISMNGIDYGTNTVKNQAGIAP